MPRGAYDTTKPYYVFVTPNHHLGCPNQDNVCDLGPQHPDYQVCTDVHGLFTAVHSQDQARTNTPPPRPPPIPYQEVHLQEEDFNDLEEAYSQHRID